MTLRLVATITQPREWSQLDGMLASQGTDPRELPLDRFLSLAYWWLTKGATPQEIDRFDTRLWMPPKGVEPAPQSPWSPENETAAFKALRAGVSTTVK